MGARKKDYPCLKCEIHVKKNDSAIQCILCELWVHQICADISDALFKELVYQTEHNGGASWTCKACRSASARFNKQISEIYRKVETLEVAKEEHDKAIQSNKEEIEAVNRRCDKIQNDVVHNKGDIQDAVFEELRERQDRKRNLIIHNLPEPENELNNHDKKEADLKQLDEIFGTLKTSLKSERDVKFLRRIGEKGEQTRPLLIGMTDERDKYAVLSKGRNLARTRFEKISIIPDLTKKQRSEENRMREEAKKRNDELTEEDFLNFEWRLVGLRGERRLAKVKKDYQRTNWVRQPRERNNLERTRERISSQRRTREEDSEDEHVQPASKR